MQLLRVLNPNSGLAQFQSTLQGAPVSLKPNSKVALKSLSFILNSGSITIPAGLEFQWTVSGITRTVALKPGVYSTPADLCNMLTNVLNSKTTFLLQLGGVTFDPDLTLRNGYVLNGFSWLSYSKDNKSCSISFTRSEVAIPAFNHNAGDASLNLDYYKTSVPLCKGSFAFQFRIASSSTDISNSVWSVGLTQVSSSITQTEGLKYDLNSLIGITNSQTNNSYAIYLNGNLIKDGIDMGGSLLSRGQNNSCVIHWNGNGGGCNIQFFRTSGGTTASEIVQINGSEFDFSTDIYPYYAVESGPIVFDKFKFTPSAMINLNNNGDLHRIESVLDLDANHTVGALEPIPVAITPGASGVYLGYASTRKDYPSGVNGELTGLSLISNQLNDSIIVECGNLNLLSYDTLTGGRRSILAVIDSLNSIDILDKKRFFYTAPEMTFLDISNRDPLELYNLNFRVLVSSGNTDSVLNTAGQLEMCLVFSD